MSDQGKNTAQQKEREEVIIFESILKRPVSLKWNMYGKLKKIRARYRKASLKNSVSGVEEWLCDNYYLIEAAAKQVIKSVAARTILPCVKNNGLPTIYEYISRFFTKKMISLTHKNILFFIEEMQQEYIFSTVELGFLETALKASFVDICYHACMDRDVSQQAIEYIAYGVTGLRTLSDVDFEEILENLSYIEKILIQDPAGIYLQMDNDSKNLYRHKISEISRQKHVTEEDLVEAFLKKANEGKSLLERHIGHYIFSMDVRPEIARARGNGLLSLNVVMPALWSIIVCCFVRNFYILPLLYFALYEILRPLHEHHTMRRTNCATIPKLELKNGVPDDAYTLIAVTSLLPLTDESEKLKARLEDLYFKNQDNNIGFILLADYKESEYPTTPQDKLMLDNAEEVVHDLNNQYGERFYLFVRKRSFNKASKVFSGWERKRGAITQLIRYIKGQAVPLDRFAGNEDTLRRTRYLITLDADTGLLLDGARQLVGAALHPLNHPQIDETKNIVVAGYGILTPRISTELKSAYKTPFSKVMAGIGGTSTYDTKQSDIYQDLFGASLFTGKGLIHVDAFYTVLDQRFDEGVVLSHDILEGSYLRTGFVSGVEMTDSFPPSTLSYFNRLHRWIRGDWQNSPYLFGKVKCNGMTEKNPFAYYDRYKIWDNLRRSLIPVIAVLCIICACFVKRETAMLLAAASFLSIAFGQLYAAFLNIASGGFFTLSREYFSKPIARTLDLFAQVGVNFILLPYHAHVAVDAIARTIYRMFVSKKNLLQWTPAADADRIKSPAAKIILKFLPSILFAFALIFAPYNILKLYGCLFIFAPILAVFTAKEYPHIAKSVSKKERETILSYGAAMWEFYEHIFCEEDHYLPPDNIQEAPTNVVAHRTSPTNIGLMLLSFLAARDMGFIDTEKMVDYLEKSLGTVNKMKKWHGNLYNWYDTRTLNILHPAFVSSVDSANFVCCLIALKEGLSDYMADNSKYRSLYGKIQKLVDKTDLSVFYNERKKVYSIGYDESADEMNKAYYDLLMSEARLASYFGIAMRQVPKKHWGALGRTLSRVNKFAGPMSWSGTMFEYFMPHILLPAYEGSLLYEALRFCMHCQKKAGSQGEIPWGISESGFYAFDNHLNYQYKAHGVQKLGLKRGLYKDHVISPYSTFLTLPFDIHDSLNNLSAISKMGGYGKFGFYEALDFTKSRTQNSKMSIIRSYMSHHVGMSFLSADNALNDMIMQRRFMKDKMMRSANELLEEKIESGAALYDGSISSNVPEKKDRITSESEEYKNSTPIRPKVQILSNGEWTSIFTDVGASFSSLRGYDLIRASRDLLRRPSGIFMFLGDKNGAFSLTPAPDYSPSIQYTTKFTAYSAEYFTKSKELETGIQIMVSNGFACEQRKIILRNRSNRKLAKDLLIYFEPALAKTRDDQAHPVFSKMFIGMEYDKTSNVLIFSRRPKGNEGRLSLAVGFLETVRFNYESDKTKVLTSPYGTCSLKNFYDKSFTGGSGVPDSVCAIRLEIPLPPNSQYELNFAMTAADTKEEAVGKFVMARLRGRIAPSAACKSPLMNNTMQSRLAHMVAPELLFPSSFRGEERAKAVGANRHGIPALWGLSISGDDPIVLIEMMEASDDMGRLSYYIQMLQSLRAYGIVFDLAIAYREKEDEIRPFIMRYLEEHGASNLLGQRSGIHLVNLAMHDPYVETLLKAVASHQADQELSYLEQEENRYTPLTVIPSEKTDVLPADGVETTGGIFFHDRFYITQTPNVPWCHILANPTFGTLVSDKSMGFTWAINARENKLTPWYNDVSTDNNGEMILLKKGSRYVDLLNGTQVSFSTTDAKYEGKAGNIYSTVQVNISQTGCVKYCTITLYNAGEKVEKMECLYYTEPVLGVDRMHARMLSADIKDNVLVLHNAFSSIPGYMGLTSDHKGMYFSMDRAAVLSGDLEKNELLPNNDPCAAAIVPLKLPPKKKTSIRYILTYARDEDACIKMGQIPLKPWNPMENTITVSTPDQLLNSVINYWMPHQTLRSRIMGRTGFYQCGGAWGFRDQLQDMSSMVVLAPALAKQHILRAAAAQFEEGDVMHWWHALPKCSGGKKGVRTMCSDDLLWLPYTTCRYIEVTGDKDILEVQVPYATGPVLADTEHERYFEPGQTAYKESLYLHCKKAIDHTMRFGEHGLPLIGNGDWNDGFNQVGANGRGESVWLAQFMAMVLDMFGAICLEKGESEQGDAYYQISKKLRNAVDEHCYEQDHYIRAFYDNGRKMGSEENDECKIDLLPQSFAVLSKMENHDRIRRALDTAYTKLVDTDKGIIKLFTPAFRDSTQNPGYVKSYPAGLRENGGQYTHASIWFAMAMLEFGEVEKAYKLITMLNPANRYMDAELARDYVIEPHYMAADIYTNPNAYGRGGWSLYTGAAGWYYRLVTEHLLGIRVHAGSLTLEPRLPKEWEGFSATLFLFNTKVQIRLTQGGRDSFELDGVKLEDELVIPLDQKPHHVLMEVRREP